MEHAFYVTVRSAADSDDVQGYVLYCRTGEKVAVTTFDELQRFIQAVVVRSEGASDGHSPSAYARTICSLTQKRK